MSFKIKDEIAFGGGVVLSRNRRTESPGLYLRGGRLNVATGGITVDAGNISAPSSTLTLSGKATITQTDSTAEAELAADTVTSIAAAVPAITNYVAHAAGAVTVTSNAATDLDTTAAALDTLENEVTSLATWATEVDLDFEALIVDVRDLKSAFNSVVDSLQAQGLLG